MPRSLFYVIPRYVTKNYEKWYCILWWHISAITCQIIMSTCQIIMSTCQIFMLTCQIIMSTCQKIIITTNRLISCFHNVFMPLTAIYSQIDPLRSSISSILLPWSRGCCRITSSASKCCLKYKSLF